MRGVQPIRNNELDVLKDEQSLFHGGVRWNVGAEKRHQLEPLGVLRLLHLNLTQDCQDEEMRSKLMYTPLISPL